MEASQLSASRTAASAASTFHRAGSVLQQTYGDLIVSKLKLRQAESIACVRLKRRSGGTQNVGFVSRPFVLCGLPIKRPPPGTLLHERRNGRFVLQVAGHPSYGVPWGQDRLVPIFLATLTVRQQSRTITFTSAADMLETFGMQRGGSQYRRLVAAFQRIFGATILNILHSGRGVTRQTTFSGTPEKTGISPNPHGEQRSWTESLLVVSQFLG
jgi:hypothetical protein